MIAVAIFVVAVLMFVAGALSAWTLTLRRPVTWDDLPGLMQGGRPLKGSLNSSDKFGEFR